MMVAALGFAKDEVLWYFYHYDVDMNGTRMGKSKRMDAKSMAVGGVGFDSGISELLWLIQELRLRLHHNKQCK